MKGLLFLRPMETNINIVFYDGECGLCNRFISFVVKRDEKHFFYFASLQGSTAKEKLGELPQQMDTVFYLDNKGIYAKSSAAIRILSRLGGMWNLMFVLLLVPSFIRNYVYDFVAARRYRWFGKNDSCTVPGKEEMSRFLE